MTFLKSTFHSFKDPSFRIYFIGLLFMMASVNMQFVARSQLAYDLTKSPLAVGIVGSGFAPPILLLSIFGGSISDQFDKKKIIQLGQLGMVILASIIAISIFLEIVTIYHLIVASVAQGIMWAFLVPAVGFFHLGTCTIELTSLPIDCTEQTRTTDQSVAGAR